MGDGRKGDEVHLRHRDALHLPRKLLGAFARVVDALDDGVFERYYALRRLRVVRARREQRVERPFSVDGHELVSEGVVRRVQRHGKLELYSLGCELREARDHAAGRERYVPCAEVGAAPRVDEL